MGISSRKHTASILSYSPRGDRRKTEAAAGGSTADKARGDFKHNLHFKGWNSQAHRELPREFEVEQSSYG